VFAGLADRSRRRLLDELAGGDRTVGQLTLAIGISQPAVSQHLQVLSDAGLVEMRREGRCHRYRLRLEGLAGLRDWLHELERFWRLRVDALGTYLAESE
jgi:DNA-binding transcriptional ArsR family regulator